jgi:hypothetical protein
MPPLLEHHDWVIGLSNASLQAAVTEEEKLRQHMNEAR